MAAQCVGLFLLIVGSQAAGDLLKAKSGDKITLQCNSSTDAAVTLLVWTRTDLEDDYVFFFRHNRVNENYQDPRYRGRVELKDPEMKNGDSSVLLKEVTEEDTGTYQCQVIPSMNRWKRNVGELGTLVNSVQLIVEGPGDGQAQSGQAALRAGPGFVSLLLLLLLLGCL
ncbi:coxsackievirus and adenovirus receptor homolog [Pseudochaenichthys georgianus]|uniref:coxsackievirus and adenovirus receptor homolog n=1 Tax=Pseudochaenichthys georgianus TaxID=52239 RepID=UPI00146A91B3|nr:coxsackievirus and adenovirus receptor homolog [Pseudochaenichthys georgianus]